MCFSLAWIAQTLIALVLICGVVYLLRIWILPMLGGIDPRLPATINVVVWVVVCIVVIWFVVDLLSCLLGSGGPLHRLR